ncbi:MAG: methyltransferase domain-containing protein [Myxococcales bacterium]
MITEEQCLRTLARYEQHRRMWDSNEAVRTLYRDWYGAIAARLPDRGLGPFVELGSGPGFAREFIPGLQLSDVVSAPWLNYKISADELPFANGTVGALVLFDVLHHVAEPGRFLAEAERVLAVGGRVVLCEPYMSPLSFPIYRFLHQEPVVLGVDPLAPQVFDPSGKDPFDSNQAIATLAFDREQGRRSLSTRFPKLVLGPVERLAGLSYVASGGFSRAPLLPVKLWQAIRRLEAALPPWFYRLIGFRMLVTLEKRHP